MKTIKYFSVDVIADCEGRSMKTLANFDDEVEAHKFADLDIARDMYGKKGSVRQRVITITCSCEEGKLFYLDQIKRKVLQKLTQEEKEALGL